MACFWLASHPGDFCLTYYRLLRAEHRLMVEMWRPIEHCLRIVYRADFCDDCANDPWICRRVGEHLFVTRPHRFLPMGCAHRRHGNVTTILGLCGFCVAALWRFRARVWCRSRPIRFQLRAYHSTIGVRLVGR